MLKTLKLGMMAGLMMAATVPATADTLVPVSAAPVGEAALLDAVAPWRERTYRIPVYVDGRLVGYYEITVYEYYER